MNTKEYVNQSKSFGIMFVSLMMVSLIGFRDSLIKLNENMNISTISVSFLILAFIAGVWYIGRELVKSRYRSRAIKIYTNYLTNKEAEIQA